MKNLPSLIKTVAESKYLNHLRIIKIGVTIDAMQISYGCVYKRSSKPVMKGSSVETVESAMEVYKKLLAEGWKKTSIFISYF